MHPLLLHTLFSQCSLHTPFLLAEHLFLSYCLREIFLGAYADNLLQAAEVARVESEGEEASADESFLFMIFAPCAMHSPPFLATFGICTSVNVACFGLCSMPNAHLLPPFTTICGFCHTAKNRSDTLRDDCRRAGCLKSSLSCNSAFRLFTLSLMLLPVIFLAFIAAVFHQTHSHHYSSNLMSSTCAMPQFAHTIYFGLFLRLHRCLSCPCCTTAHY